MAFEQPINYLDFNNPIHIIWRKGTASDPFIDRLDITKVVNQRVALLEIPDQQYRVRIANMFEINYEKFIKNNLATTEFYCDYTNGFIYFNKDKEAETLSVVYKGRGVILYPTSRIIHTDGSDGQKTLAEVIDESKEAINDLAQSNQQFEEVLENMIVATNLTKEATDILLQTNITANQKIELINDAYDTTVLIYQPYVEKYSDIATTYPLPSIGWTVQVYDTGIRYRWSGIEWTPIDALGGSVPLATEFYDGLLSKEQFVKVEDISEEVDYRTIVFICPREILQGVQDPHIVFPYDGEITEVNAYVSQTGGTLTPIRIESSQDFIMWNPVLNSDITINANEYKDNGLATVLNNTVLKNDVFRLYIPTFDVESYNLTLNIKIKID